ncbi:MAG: hypothetical protein MJ090_03395 [Clostridia bacterium]|nr:hypothetical protein [Clostridia bacterium]
MLRYVLGQLILSDEVVTSIRRKFKKLFPDMKIDADRIKEMISSEIVKREILDLDQSKEAVKIIKKAEKKVAQKATNQE